MNQNPHIFIVDDEAPAREMVGETADGGRVTTAVVVDDNDHRPFGRGDVIQRLSAHPAGQRTITDDGDDVPIALPAQFEGLGQSVGVGQRR